MQSCPHLLFLDKWAKTGGRSLKRRNTEEPGRCHRTLPLLASLGAREPVALPEPRRHPQCGVDLCLREASGRLLRLVRSARGRGHAPFHGGSSRVPSGAYEVEPLAH